MNDERDDADWSMQEMSLLRSAELDAPPEGSADRTLAALGLGAVAGATGGAVVTSKSSGLWLKWLGGVVVGGGAVGLAVVALSAGSQPNVAVATSTPAPRVAPVVSTAPPPPEEPPVVPETKAAVAKPATAPSAKLRERTAPVQLLDEIRLIDESRRALRVGDAAAALAALHRYDALVGRGGSMQAEATVVRVEALQLSGDRAGARALGERFLSANPTSPYAESVRRTLAPSPAAK